MDRNLFFFLDHHYLYIRKVDPSQTSCAELIMHIIYNQNLMTIFEWGEQLFEYTFELKLKWIFDFIQAFVYICQ